MKLSGAGGKQPRILLFGDSHSHAVHEATKKRLAKGVPVPLSVFRPRKEKETGVRVGNTTFPEFLELVSKLDRADVVLSMIGGNEYAAFSTLQHPQPFDFFDKNLGAAVASGAEIIPYMAVSAYFADRISMHTGRWLRMLRDATPARVVHTLPPPPIGDNEFIARHYETLSAGSASASNGVSPPELRLKCWQMERRMLYKLCSKAGIEVMPPPPKSSDGGFLRPKYYGHDPHHANWMYGELVLRSVEAGFR